MLSLVQRGGFRVAPSLVIRLLSAALLLGGGADLGRAAYMPAKAVLAQWLLTYAFDDGLKNGEAKRPWPWADTKPMARLTFERLGKAQIVLSGGSGQAMAFGPAHLPGSALPGHDGTTVIAAHRDSHFAVLRHVRVGDVIAVEGIDGARGLYRVESLGVIRAEDFGIQDDGVSRLVLATCYPFGVKTDSPWRYIVVATRDAEAGGEGSIIDRR